MPYHTVAQGECLTRIASRYGFASYDTIWNHPVNADLRQKRPDPHVIHPGDRLFIPTSDRKEVHRSTGASHQFKVRRMTKMLRLAVEDLAGKRIAGAAYELLIEDQTFTGTTDGEGKLEQKIPADAEKGTLKVGERTWPLLIGHLNPIDETPDRGSTGIQARLRNLGYDPGPIDGLRGARTEAAIRAFQRDNPPLTVDGICGPETRAKLIEKHGC